LLQANSKKRKEGGGGTGGKGGGGAGGKGGGGAGGKEAEEQAEKQAEKQARSRHRLILIVSNHCHAYFWDLIFKHIFYIQEQNCAAQTAAAAASQQFWTWFCPGISIPFSTQQLAFMRAFLHPVNTSSSFYHIY
jgi:hypothetical protein